MKLSSIFLLAILLCLGWLRPVLAEDVVVASKSFPESQLLAEIMAQLIEYRTDLKVERKFNLDTLVCFNALQSGEIDVYPEYTGTGLLEILKEELGNQRQSADVLRRVKQGFHEQFQVEWLETFGFNNSFAFAVREDSPLQKISDIRQHQDELRARFQHAFLDREDGYPGVAKHYGFQIKDVGGMEHGLAYIALDRGQIDLMEAYTTDGVLKKYPIRLLEDDLHYYPPYDAAPVVREATLEKYPELKPLLNELAGRLTQDRMTALNFEMAEKGRLVTSVASEFLAAEGLVTNIEVKSAWVQRLQGLTLQLGQHLRMTLIATICATILGISLGVLIAGSDKLAGPVLATVGVLQTVPGLALLAFMVPLLGLGWIPVTFALFLYALLPIVRNTYTGITSVPAELKDAGRAMGMTDRQLLWQLELPLAIRTIMAGIRTALVITTGTATLGAYMGAGGLGDPIARGLQQSDTTQVLWGAIPAALLALACDWGMARLEKTLQPKGLQITK